MKKTMWLAIAIVLSLGMILAGCGGGEKPASSNNTTASSGDSQAASGDVQVIKLGTQSPLSGPYAEMGESIKLGAELAVADWADKLKALGVEVQLFPQDDQGDPKIGVANAERLVSDAGVLGVVGHLNSGVTRAAAPKYQAAGLTIVSPANTGVDLSESGWSIFHRICARDDLQGPVGAQFIQADLGVKTVFIVHDKTAYGQGLADAFRAEAKNLGMEEKGYEGVEATVTDLTSIANKINAVGADAVYFGGMYNQTALLLKQVSERGFKGYFVSGDGSDNAEFIKIAGADNVKKSIITSAAGDVTRTEEGKAWSERYKAKFSKDTGTYSVYGYDSALVFLTAIEKLATEKKEITRESIQAEVHATKDLKGVFSTITFDEKGDNANASIFVYSYEDATYPGKFIKQLSKK